MGKAKISAKQKSSHKSMPNKPQPRVRPKNRKPITRYKPHKSLANEKFVALAIWDALCNNEPEEIVDIVKGHLLAVNKLKMCQEGEIPRSTLYHTLRQKNPTLKTLARVISSKEFQP